MGFTSFVDSLQAEAARKAAGEKELIASHKAHHAKVHATLGPRCTMSQSQAWQHVDMLAKEKHPEIVRKLNDAIGKAVRAQVGCAIPEDDPSHGMWVKLDCFNRGSARYYGLAIRDRTPRIGQEGERFHETPQSRKMEEMLAKLPRTFMRRESYETRHTEMERLLKGVHGGIYEIDTLKQLLTGINQALSRENRIDPQTIHPALPSRREMQAQR